MRNYLEPEGPPGRREARAALLMQEVRAARSRVEVEDTACIYWKRLAQ